MKKILLVSTAVLILLGSNVQAQDKKNVLKLNLFSIPVMTGSLFYERALNEKMAAQLGVSYTSITNKGTGLTGIGITPEFRFYPSGTAPKGFFVGPFARYRALTMKATFEDFDLTTGASLGTTTSKGTWTQIGGGVVLGYHWLIGDVFSMELFGGPAYYSNSFKYDDGANEDDFSIKGGGNFSFRSGFTVGVAF